MNKTKLNNCFFDLISPSIKEGDIFFLICILLLSFFNAYKSQSKKDELWRFKFSLNDSVHLTIDANMMSINKQKFIRIPAYDTTIFTEAHMEFKLDSVFFTIGLYSNKFLLKKESNEKITGRWIKYSGNKNYVLPLVAYKINSHELKQKEQDVGFMKNFPKRLKFKITSIKNNNLNEALGIFQPYMYDDYMRLKGSIATKTGDLGNLIGEVKNDSLYLSVFNGAFATQIVSKIYYHSSQQIDSLNGIIYYGNWGIEKFTAVPDTTFELSNQVDIDEILITKSAINFNLKDIDGKPLNIEKNKPCIVQIMGSWCPNCIDELKLFAQWQDSLKNKIQFIALCIERTNERQKAIENLNKLRTKYHISYPMVLLSFKGTADIEGFPELKKILAFPTTIYLNKNHKPLYAFIGFSGPATGQEYHKTKREILRTIQKIVEDVHGNH